MIKRNQTLTGDHLPKPTHMPNIPLRDILIQFVIPHFVLPPPIQRILPINTHHMVNHLSIGELAPKKQTDIRLSRNMNTLLLRLEPFQVDGYSYC